MSIIYAIYLIWLYNIDHHKHCMFHSLSANWSMVLEASWAWNHCAFECLPINPIGKNKICDHRPWHIPDLPIYCRWDGWVLQKLTYKEENTATWKSRKISKILTRRLKVHIIEYSCTLCQRKSAEHPQQKYNCPSLDAYPAAFSGLHIQSLGHNLHNKERRFKIVLDT